MLGDEPGEVAAVEAAGHVVSRRDGAERAGVVDEPGRPVETRGLRDDGAEPGDRLGRVEEPPGHPGIHRGVEARDRRDLAGEGRLVDREDHQVEALGGAEPFEQRPQPPGELGGHRDVVAAVRAVPRERRCVVVSVDPRVQRHDEAVLHGHPRHLHEHVPAQRGRFLRRGLAAQRRRVDAGRLGVLELQGHDVGVAVVGRDRAVGLEMAAPLGEGLEIAGEVAGVLTGRLSQRPHELAEIGSSRLEVAVRPERGHDPAVEPGVGREGPVELQVVAGVVGRGEHVDAEALEQGPWPERLRRQAAGNLVVEHVRGRGRRALGGAEHVGEHALHPVPAGRAPEQRPPLAEDPPRLS